jgi:hypothetical protein
MKTVTKSIFFFTGLGFINFLFIFSTPKANVIQLFNGKNLDGWYTFLEKKGKNHDPDKVFSVEYETIHISGKEFGYICTPIPYENFKLTVEFKWGEQKHAPRENSKRDSGIIYHIPDNEPDKLWPTGIECQIQETDCGDFWLIGGVTMNSKHKQEQLYGLTHIPKSYNAEKPHGEWNTVEIITNNGKCSHIVNGMVVNEGFEVSHRKGKILLQSEGAEVYYKRIELQPL